MKPGFLGFVDASTSVISARFSEPLVDDKYRLEVFAQDLPADGITTVPITGVLNTDGVLLLPSDPASPDRENIFFELHLGPRIVSVVPQPVARVSGVLQQATDSMVVYFSDRDLDVASVTAPTFYQLIETNQTLTGTDDTLQNPVMVKE